MKNRLIVALDLPTVAEARALVVRLRDSVAFYKVGMWLMFDRDFSAFVDELIDAGHQVFLDYKMYDIPETVAHGVANVAARGVRMVTVHGDPAIIGAAVAAVRGTSCQVFAVTVLTSQDDDALRAMGHGQSVPELVALRVRLAAAAGAHGIIASAADDPATLRKAAGTPLLVATPGIRLPGGDTHDQKRVATPDDAIRRGADLLVVGRPIVRASDPAAAARTVLALMESAVAPG